MMRIPIVLTLTTYSILIRTQDNILLIYEF